MRFSSTRGGAPEVSISTAVLDGLAPDGGLYMPTEIPRLQEAWLESLRGRSLVDIGSEVSRLFLRDTLDDEEIVRLIEEALTFDSPLVEIEPGVYVLELFHGPTLAFKDFGACFMARLMARLDDSRDDRPLTVLVATSGDTGSAVGQGFLGVEGTEVVLLFPAGRVSPTQEKMLTTMGGNVTALEVEGSFDDCQRMVKAAFRDEACRRARRLTSANSINIARLIPQSFYYFRAVAQLSEGSAPPVFSVPSGNFGNLTGGLLAERMGLEVARFLAATNANRVLPEFLESGEYRPRPSVATVSNAMDVGDPSNFARLDSLWGAALRTHLDGEWVTDARTVAVIEEVEARSGYLLDPHAAVGFEAWTRRRAHYPGAPGVVLATAHPAKFPESLGAARSALEIPSRLSEQLVRPQSSRRCAPTLEALREALLAD